MPIILPAKLYIYKVCLNNNFVIFSSVTVMLELYPPAEQKF